MCAYLLLSLFFHSWTGQDLGPEMVRPIWRVGLPSYKKPLRGTRIGQPDLNNPSLPLSSGDSGWCQVDRTIVDIMCPELALCQRPLWKTSL